MGRGRIGSGAQKRIESYLVCIAGELAREGFSVECLSLAWTGSNRSGGLIGDDDVLLAAIAVAMDRVCHLDSEAVIVCTRSRRG
jgi:hypothetical protein